MYKIYMVEDDATIAGTLKEHLEKWDYKVRCAKDFRNITEEFAGFSPELVVMDILLPLRSTKYQRSASCFSRRREIT